MLKGARVTLRALTKADLPTILAYSQDMEVELLSGGNPPQPWTQEAWEKWYDEHLGKEQTDSVNFGIEAEGKLIGTCGLWRYSQTAQRCDLGISIGDREYWGRGYGREAVGLMVEYAFRIRNFHKVALTTSSNNERAIRCYLAAGFIEEGRLRQHHWVNGAYVDEVAMGILRDEWERRRAERSPANHEPTV
ncbi:MAG TPA: GNAT family protein [Chthonomonadaceae bacterium]|nr:GNAT family protein [Chthonomonadaceae bacterium]